ncbi:zinc finger, CCHC-type containing protein [Tanacetum coccineum]
MLNIILMYQQHQGESLSEAWTCFKDLLQKVPHGIELWLQVQIFYNHVNPATRQTIDQSAVGWDDPRDFTKPVKEISLPQDTSRTPDQRLLELEDQISFLLKDQEQLPEQAQRTFLKCIVEDVFVKIAGYIYLVDILILDVKEDKKKPFILGTPFLTTAKVEIRFDKGTITLKSGKNKINFFKIPESLCRVEEGTENDIDPAAPTTTVSRLILEWEERIKLHQEKEMEFNQ